MNIHILHRPLLAWERPVKRAFATGGVALAVSVAAGSTFSSFAKTLRSVLSPLSLMFVSETLSVLFVIVSYGLIPVLRRFSHLRMRQLRWLLLMAALSGVAGPLFLFTGLSSTTAVNAGLFSKSETIFIMILANIVLSERITRSHFAAILSVLTGIVIISVRGFSEGIVPQWGDLFVILSALCYASGSIVFRSRLGGIEPHIALFSRSMTAVAAFFLASPFLDHPFIEEISRLSWNIIPVLLSFAFVSRFLNSVTYYVAIDHLPVTTVSLVGTLDVIGTAFFAFWFLGEPILWYHAAGGLFIVLGNVLLELQGTHPTHAQLEGHLKHRIP